MRKEITTTDLAELLGISTRNLQLLTQKGIIKPLPKTQKQNGNRYNTAAATQAYIRYVGEMAARVERSDLKEKLLVEEIRLKNAKATVAEYQKKDTESQYHEAIDVENTFISLHKTIKEEVEKLPETITSRLHSQGEALNTDRAAEIVEVIKDEVYKVLYKLSNFTYNPEA